MRVVPLPDTHILLRPTGIAFEAECPRDFGPFEVAQLTGQ